MTYRKWKPPKDKLTEEFISNCKLIHSLCTKLRARLGNLLKHDEMQWQELELMVERLASIMHLYRSVNVDTSVANCLLNACCEFWRSRIWHHRLATLYLANQVISHVLVHCVDAAIQAHQANIIKLVLFFNELLGLNLTCRPRGITVVKNTCPSLLQPLRKLSMTKLLQILAQHRAEECAVSVVNILLDVYYDASLVDEPETEPLVTDDEMASSENSSMEIYRTLTRYMTPPQAGADPDCPEQEHSELTAFKNERAVSDVVMLDSLLYSEDRRLTPILTTISQTAPHLLGPQAIKKTNTGEQRVCKRVKRKVLEYYGQVLWGEVGSCLDHILLWWGQRPLGSKTAHHFRNWLRNFVTTVTVPEVLRPALHSLLDSLCCHVSSASWDQLFRQALVAAGTQHKRHVVNDSAEGTHTGLQWSEVFSDLVFLSNGCEGPNWTIADLEELPVVEQIPILHRLDHSIHSAILWAEARAKQLANSWDMEQFMRTTQCDVNTCLSVLNHLKFANQVDILTVESSVHVVVCVKMRAKLISEVRANLDKLRTMPSVCVDILATVCRTVSLANLHMMFPDPDYWRQRIDEIPQFASNYVEDFLDELLRPVLLSTTALPLSVQQKVCGMVLNIMGEAWLDHIYAHQIKFSEWGAMQLLTDFGAVPTWLLERVNISGELRKHLLNTEVLRRCEGVGRLLLRRPGERVAMTTAPQRKKHDSANSSPRTPDLMPAEMYVPNQEKWLQLRAPRQTRVFALCCGIPS